MNMKKYLGEILGGVQLENNTLVISPTGSGKTHYIFNDLIQEGKYLYLCDNENLKTSVEYEERTFSNRKQITGFENFSVEIMCYKEFGNKVKFNNEIVSDYKMIICDEIHNLIDYQAFNNDAELSHAIKELFKKYTTTKIVYFTATPHYLEVLGKDYEDLYKILSVRDFSKSKEIKRYINRREAYINHLSQVQFQLNEYKQSFEYANLKCLIFTREISKMESLKEMCVNRGLNPICIWSRNNQKEMNQEQLRVREHLIRTGLLPEPYNVLIMNRSLETGINIYDKDMNLAIINTTNLTQQIQVRGRIRHDIDLLVVRTDEQKLPEVKIDLDEKYLGVELLKEEVEDIITELHLKNSKNKYITVAKLMSLLNNQDYQMVRERKVSNGIKYSYYIITRESL